MKSRPECVLILHNIRSAHNVGSIFRTADAAGVSSIILCGYSPAPIEKGKARPDIAKVALGAEKEIPWSVEESLDKTIRALKEKGFTVCALERTEGAKDIFSYQAPQKLALIVGNEVHGVQGETLSEMDAVLSIPMRGMKESLNVSVATGVALYALLRD